MDGLMRLDGKVAVVTGASRGLGRAMALALARAGADLVLAARSAAGLAQTRADVEALGRRALAVPADVTRWEDMENLARATADAFGRADVLVNNSGIAVEKPLLDMDPQEWEQIFATNVHGVFYGCRAFGPLLVQQGGGSVINIASAFAVMGVPHVTGYCASKAAVVQFTRALAVEWARHRIRVNAIAPGYVETDMNASVRADAALLDRLLRQVPLRRMGRPEELDPLVVYLASDASAYMTGEVLFLDGGMSVR